MYLVWHLTPCLHSYCTPFGNFWASESTIVDTTYWHYEKIQIDSSYHDCVLKVFRILCFCKLEEERETPLKIISFHLVALVLLREKILDFHRYYYLNLKNRLTQSMVYNIYNLFGHKKKDNTCGSTHSHPFGRNIWNLFLWKKEKILHVWKIGKNTIIGNESMPNRQYMWILLIYLELNWLFGNKRHPLSKNR